MKIKKTLKNYQNKSVIPAIMIERAYIFLYMKVPKKLAQRETPQYKSEKT